MVKRSQKRNTVSNKVATNITGTNASVPWLPPWLSHEWVLGLMLVVAVVLVYQPVWHAGFIWDDELITANPCIVGPLGLKEIWTTIFADICPLTFTTFWVEHALWGLRPLPYHLVNVLLQGTCAVVLWRVLRSLQIPGAWLGAALWALHPMQVESVAWVIELKNTQSGLFYLLTILFFVKGIRAKDDREQSNWNWNYALTLLFAALAMASKSSTVVLPGVLCLCAWWVQGRWHWHNLARVAPIFLMSVAAAVLTMWRQDIGGANNPHWARSWPERLVTAGDGVWFYLGKLLWPHPLSIIYPRWQIDFGQWVSYLPLMAVMIGLFVLWLNRQSWSRPYFFASAYFLVVLLPVLGLVNQYFLRYSFVADHFQYLAGMGPLALAGTGLSRFVVFAIPGRGWIQSILCAGLLLILGMLSWQRIWAYDSEETIWTDTLAKNPNCWAGYNRLGWFFYEKGQVDKAIAQYQKALEINPYFADGHNNLGNALLKKEQVDEAIAQFQKALELKPDFGEVYNNLGYALLKKGQVDEAIAQYQKALEINPNYADAYINLGKALLQKGQVDKAIEQYQKALEINPNYADAYMNLGKALLQKGQTDGAIVQFQMALKINPNYAEAHNNLGNALLQEGRNAEANEQYEQTLRLNPNLAEAHLNLGNVLLNTGQLSKALEQYGEALKINPNLPEAHNSMGVVLALMGQTSQAIEHYEQALRLKPDYTEAHNNLGMALSQTGRTAEAIAQFEAALRINPNYTNAQNNLAKVKALAAQKPAQK